MMTLNSNIQLDDSGTYKSTRDGSGEALIMLGEQNENVVVLTADLPESTRVLAFGKQFPDRYFNVGVAEQNMAGIAAGLALSGKTVFAASFGVFSPGRNWDQIRVSICYSNANVKILSTHTGLGVGEDGATHQALEDIAITRVLPRMTVIAPGDAVETQKAVIAAAQMRGPVYLRLGRQGVRTYTTAQTPFAIGKAYVYTQGTDITILTTGSTLEFAMKAAYELDNIGIHAEVVHCPTIKPLDEETILASLTKTKCAVSIEDHQKAAGFGSAVLEAMAKHILFPMEIIGMSDTFGQSGTYAQLFEKYGISTQALIEKAKEVVARKNT